MATVTPADVTSAVALPSQAAAVQGQVQTVFANQARVQDAVLTETLAANSSSEASGTLSPASTLKSLTNAVDNVLATYNDDTFDV